MNLENIIMFSGPSCGACRTMKHLLEEEDITINKIVDVESEEGMELVPEYRIRHLPTFVNTKNHEQIVGTLKKTNDLVILNYEEV